MTHLKFFTGKVCGFLVTVDNFIDVSLKFPLKFVLLSVSFYFGFSILKYFSGQYPFKDRCSLTYAFGGGGYWIVLVCISE